MAGYGPPPSEEKRRRNGDTFEDSTVTVSSDHDVKAPKLPGASKYLQQTRIWYEGWSTSPMAAAFLATDWQRLHMLAPLVDQYWRDPNPKILAEIRQSESLLGATHVDRMRGRIKVAEPSSNGPAVSGGASAQSGDNVTPISSRRERLLAEGS